MSKLWLLGLAASAAWAPMAMAQPAPPPPPPPPMAHGMHGPMPMPPMPNGGQMHMPHDGQMMRMHRIDRGGMIPPMFMGPQFVVHDWRMFGFPPPMPGGRWVRYYDDALLVDGDGRVVDGRYGWDWDGYDDHRMGDHDDDYDDDEWADDDGYGRGHHDGDRRIVRIYRHRDGPRGDCRRSCTRTFRVPAPPPPYPYGYGYGYGAGCGCGGVVITETTTTTAPVVEMRTYYETVTEHRAAPRRHYRKPVHRAPPPPPRPRPGERG